MMCVSLLTLLGISWMLLTCKGQLVTVTPEMNKYDVLKGEDVQIKWNISGVDASTLVSRLWKFVKIDENIAGIDFDLNVTKFTTTILGEGFDVIKPSTLILKKADERYDGEYRFRITKGVALAIDSAVTVLVLKVPVITRDCPSVNFVIQGDNFTCTCYGKDGKPQADSTWYKNNTQIVTGKENAMLVLSNVTNKDSGTYKCVAKSHEKAQNKTSIELIVYYAPDRVKLERKGLLVMCIADGQPDPSYIILLNGTVLVYDKTFTIPRGNYRSYAGYYKCFAENFVGNASSEPEYIFIQEIPIITFNCSSSTAVKQGDYFACECKERNGNPPADVTWYKGNTKIVTGKEKAILVRSNVDRDDSGSYRCEAKSHERAKIETSIDLFVITTPVIQVNCSTCSSTTVIEGDYFACECKGADGNPPADVTWYDNDDEEIVTEKEKAILRFTNVDKDNSGTYRCEAKSHEKVKNETSIELIVTNKACPDNMSCGVEWYIIVVTLVSGLIAGVLLTYIVQCSRRRWFRERKSRRNPDEQPAEADSTYQELDLSKMNQEDNYQSLRGNVARINDVTNDDESTYTELSKTRDVEDNYQSLT